MPRKTALVKSNNWWIQLTADHEFLLSKYKDIKTWLDFSGAFVATHSGDTENPNPHIHMALQLKSNVQQQTIYARLVQLTGCVKNSNFVVPWDLSETVLRYCYHEQVSGKPSTVINDLNLPAEMLVRLERESAIVTPEVKKDKTVSAYK